MTNLKIQNLRKNYGSVNALDDFSLEIASGELMVLLGPSGCGKTTVLRCIAGLETPSGGEIYIGDHLVNGVPPKDRDVAMVFQNYALYPHMSVYDNVAFPLKMRKASKQYTDEKVRYVANLLEIEDFLDRKPKQLSGGQMQRVALGRALVREPKVFLMDEPLSNLDAKLRVYMRAEIRKLQKKVGITTVYVTHDQVEAMSMADNIAVIESGLLQQLGTPEQVYDEPTNIFVAGFIGSPPMNFLECEMVPRDFDVYLESQGIILKLPSMIAKLFGSPLPRNVTIGIRPKDIVFLDNESFDGLKLNGEVSFTELLGDDVIVDVKIGSNSIKVTSTSSRDLSSGKNVMLGLPFDKINFFDTKTGKRF
ncbi:MAG: ABC transporter ATP-binding protein [Nitrososphaerales archaeon]